MIPTVIGLADDDVWAVAPLLPQAVARIAVAAIPAARAVLERSVAPRARPRSDCGAGDWFPRWLV
jgi:hypothetical protein